ncbi:hypothetical protein CBP27_23935, partial [Fischerella thermalis WC542]
ILTQQDGLSNSPSKTLRDRITVARLGADAYLQKFASPSDIWRVVNRLLHRFDPITAKLLIVDDDPDLLTRLQTQLQSWGFQVTGLSDPSQFWSVLQTTRPDLLLLDVSMPEYSGIDLCRVVRCDPIGTPCPSCFCLPMPMPIRCMKPCQSEPMITSSSRSPKLI